MLRRGVYVHHDFFDPWIVTSRLAPDVIFAFDGALSLRGLGGAYNLSYLTRSRLQPICFNERILQPVRVETASAWNSLYPETIDVERAGFTLRVTRLERSLIDCVERLDRAPELPDLVDAFRLAGPINFDRLLDYVHARKSPLLAARLAFFLHCARRLDPVFGGALMSAGLQRPDYFLRTARGPEDSSRRSLQTLDSLIAKLFNADENVTNACVSAVASIKLAASDTGNPDTSRRCAIARSP
jgi:hypothetical protein